MSVYEKLMNIQSQLKAPKSQLNKFGNYNYRSCEDIVEALKPLLKDNKLALTMTDTVEQIGDRYYIKTTVRLTDVETSEGIEVFALAREEETKKGMDASQLTGSTSSYARKYALNGMFCIDDTKDSDGTNRHGKGETSDEQGKQSGTQQPPATGQNNSSDNPLVAEAAKIVIGFGKHKGKTLGTIFKEAPDYVKWFLEKGTDQGIKKAFTLLAEAVEEAKKKKEQAPPEMGGAEYSGPNAKFEEDFGDDVNEALGETSFPT